MSDNPPVKHRGLITAFAMVAMLMQSLDSTIANVALPFMQGSMSASRDEVNWILTSYVIAAPIMTAPVGWMAVRCGRKTRRSRRRAIPLRRRSTTPYPTAERSAREAWGSA